MTNLLPQTQKAAILRLYRKRFFSVACGAVVIVAVIGIGLLLPSRFLLDTSEAKLTGEEVVLNGHETSTIAASLSSAIDDINGRLGVFAESAPISPLVASFMQPVLAADTSSVHITDFSYIHAVDSNSARVQVSGTADSREALLAFTERVKAADGFSNVTLPITSFVKNTNVTFTITATVNLK